MQKKEAIYVYNLSSLDNVSKVRFVYALKGRKAGKGIVDGLGGHFLAPGCFIMPQLNCHKIEEVFSFWKVKFDRYLVNVLTEKHKIDYVG